MIKADQATQLMKMRLLPPPGVYPLRNRWKNWSSSRRLRWSVWRGGWRMKTYYCHGRHKLKVSNEKSTKTVSGTVKWPMG